MFTRIAVGVACIVSAALAEAQPLTHRDDLNLDSVPDLISVETFSSEGNESFGRVVFTDGATGETFVVYREYVWGPGDRGVDEILVSYDSGYHAWWCLTDLKGDLVGLCDQGGAGGAARAVA